MTVATPDLHLCIATGQNLANLIPALQCGAQEVWILETPDMRVRAGFLSDSLKSRDIKVKRIPFADDDVTTLHRQAESIAEMLDGRPVTINLTGGTKLMTLALTETLARQLATDVNLAAHPHLVYTDTRHHRLDWLGPIARSEPMRDQLRINDILLAQGYRRQAASGGAEAAEWSRAADGRKALTRQLGDDAAQLARFFSPLNAMAHHAMNEGGPWRAEQQLAFTPGGANAKLLRAAHAAGLLTWDEQTQVVFQDRSAAQYMGGGWIEEYAALKISGMRPNEWAPRVLITSTDGHTPNELDAVVVHGNRMLLVECKAAVVRENDIADWIYKLSRLSQQVGGALAQALLLSARSIGDNHRQRAKEYGVHILAADQLSTLPDYLRTWMKA